MFYDYNNVSKYLLGNISSKLVLMNTYDKALKPPFVFERLHQMNVYAF